jgi:hypothetical protein
MRVTYVTVALRGLPADSPPYEDEFLIDTGAIDCRARAKALSAAGVEPGQENRVSVSGCEDGV